MSHPYTDAYGFPLTAVETLRRMRARRPLHTGAVMTAGPRVAAPVTVHAVADLAVGPRDGKAEPRDRAEHIQENAA
jgi:hypothetical protein